MTSLSKFRRYVPFFPACRLCLSEPLLFFFTCHFSSAYIIIDLLLIELGAILMHKSRLYLLCFDLFFATTRESSSFPLRDDRRLTNIIIIDDLMVLKEPLPTPNRTPWWFSSHISRRYLAFQSDWLHHYFVFACSIAWSICLNCSVLHWALRT